MVKHCAVLHRTVHVVNLDPAAEHFDYPLLAGTLQLSRQIDFISQLSSWRSVTRAGYDPSVPHL